MVTKGMIIKGVYCTLMAMAEILFLKMLEIFLIIFHKRKKIVKKNEESFEIFQNILLLEMALQNQLTIWQTCAEAPLYYANLCSLNGFFFNGFSCDWCTKWVFFCQLPNPTQA